MCCLPRVTKVNREADIRFVSWLEHGVLGMRPELRGCSAERRFVLSLSGLATVNFEDRGKEKRRPGDSQAN